MSYDRTTVSGVSNFPVVDITHKPKRQQGDMIRARQIEEGKLSSDEGNSKSNEPLKVITLERAISYYASLSNDPENGKLYQATSKWLNELLVTRSSKIESAISKSLKEKENNNVNDSEE